MEFASEARTFDVSGREITLELPLSGLKLAAVLYGDDGAGAAAGAPAGDAGGAPARAPPRGRVLCSHGWMDNAASFSLLAPALAAAGFVVAAVDLPGHGRSAHLPPGQCYYGPDYVTALLGAAEALGWDATGYAVVGHSMSAGIASVAAGASGGAGPVGALVMLEGVGLSLRANAAADAVDTFRRGLAAVRAGSGVPRGGSPDAGTGGAYASLAAAVDARLATVARYGGVQSLSREGAEALVRRGTVPAPGGGGGVRFRHDRRIAGPALLSATEDAARAFLRAVAVPTLVVTATRGWPWPADVVAARLDALAEGGAAGGAGEPAVAVLAGAHHHHLDPESAGAVAAAVTDFLTSARVADALAAAAKRCEEHRRLGAEA